MTRFINMSDTEQANKVLEGESKKPFGEVQSSVDKPHAVRQVTLDFDHHATTPYFAVVIDNVFTEEECQQLIARSECHGYDQALVNIGGGRQLKMTDIRNNDRAIIDDPTLAEQIWQRVVKACESLSNTEKIKLNLHELFEFQEGWEAVGVNERLRFLKYAPGTYFRPHFDGSYTRPHNGDTSFATIQLYLNECSGGETRFVSVENESIGCKVVPKTGSILLFQHNLYHEGCPVKEGLKYVIRSDIMYTQVGDEPDLCPPERPAKKKKVPH
jgi:hypothetical protein